MKLFIIFVVYLLLGTSLAAASTELIIYLDKKGTAEFFGKADSGNSEISLPEGIEITEGKIRGETNILTNKAGNKWIFSFSLQDADINVRLPSSFRIIDTIGEITFDSIGRYPVSVYAYNDISVTYVLEEKQNYMIFLIPIALFLVVFFIFIKKNKKPKKKTENGKLEIIKKTLGERDNIILEALKKSGKIKSTYLRKYCQIPKASFSRRLIILEKKGLIKISGEGRNKFVEIAD